MNENDNDNSWFFAEHKHSKHDNIIIVTDLNENRNAKFLLNDERKLRFPVRPTHCTDF
jgi:hypothetical protein